MRKILVLTVLAILCTSAIAIAGWQISGWIRGGDGSEAPAGSASVGEGGRLATGQAADGGEEAPDGTGGETGPGASTSAEAVEYDNPDQRYVTETQRHQNFLIALAEGNIRRLDVVATDFQPAGDPNSSHVYVIIATDGGARSDGTIIMKYSGGMWRIATVRLTGSLAGGTNYPAPDAFEADLARAIAENQDFLKKVAEGRLAYMTINNVNRVGDAEVVLTGVVGGRGGGTYPAEMRLRKDYGLWHLTNIEAL